MSSRATIRALSLIVALIIGVCVVGSVQTPSYAGLTASGEPNCLDFDIWVNQNITGGPCSDGHVSPVEVKQIKEAELRAGAQLATGAGGGFIESPSMGLRYSSPELARTAWGRAFNKIGGGAFSTKAGKAGLIAGSASLGVTLWYMLNGDNSTSGGLRNTWDLSRSGGAYGQNFPSGTTAAPNAEGLITGVNYSTSGGVMTVNVSFITRLLAQVQDFGTQTFIIGVESCNPTGYCTSVTTSTYVQNKQVISGAVAAYAKDNTPNPVPLTVPYYQDKYVRVYAQNLSAGSANGPRRYFPYEINQPSGDYMPAPYTVTNAGDVTEVYPEYSPPSGDYVMNPSQTEQLLNELRKDQNWTDPTHEQVHGPVVHEWTNPDGSVSRRYQDGTIITTFPDGTTHIKYTDGTKVWVDPNGQIRPQDEPAPYPEPTPEPQPEPQPDPDPDPEPDPTPDPDPGASCPIQEDYHFDLPEFRLFDVFPFSLIVKAWHVMESLVAPPESPHFNIPGFGEVGVPESVDNSMVLIRQLFSLVSLVGMCFLFYALVRSGSSDT